MTIALRQTVADARSLGTWAAAAPADDLIEESPIKGWQVSAKGRTMSM